MNKKAYQTPSVVIVPIGIVRLICDSPTQKTSIATEGETPPGGWTSGNVKRNHYNVWDDE